MLARAIGPLGTQVRSVYERVVALWGPLLLAEEKPLTFLRSTKDHAQLVTELRQISRTRILPRVKALMGLANTTCPDPIGYLTDIGFDEHAADTLYKGSSARFLTPINAVIQKSDRNRARTIAHINITDEDSLTRASSVLVAQGLSKIKIRLTTDHSATGLNYCSYSPPFSYPTISDALKIVTPNCYMCVGDIERYFHSYPTAWDDRNYFCIQYKGVTWCYSKCCFGHTACPYCTSTFGAEYYRWFTHIYCIPCSYIVDDWLTAAATLARSLAQMKTISNVLESCGFTMNDAKFKSGQQIVFLGILVDMTIRFHSVSAKGFRVELQVYFDILLDNSPDLNFTSFIVNPHDSSTFEIVFI